MFGALLEDGEGGGLEVLIDSQKPLNAALHFIQPSCTASEGDTSVGDTVCQMSEVDMAVVKPEALVDDIVQMMRSYIWIQTTDGAVQQVEQEVAMFCPMICQEVIQKGRGSSKNYAISLPQGVGPSMFSLILDYCRFHQVPGRSNKEHKSFDEKFVRMDTKRLCELTSAADSLQLKPLVDLTSCALARIIEGKTPEEIREIFHLPDDLTEEEKLEPLKNTNDDPRIRLLNRLYAKKRKDLKEREKLKSVEAGEEHMDDRSVDDLLSFINGRDGESIGMKTSKNRKKNQKRKDQHKCAPEMYKKESNAFSSLCHNAKFGHELQSSLSETLKLQDVADVIFAPTAGFEDVDIDDEIDLALKEEIDREVEDFARILNSDWPERMQRASILESRRGDRHNYLLMAMAP
ncbi:SKP1-LIKE PROTEIN 20 [Salix viminalis]|uniref:SKP1-LIKE PROTEIN 20 n=1 Tax=Salix viminalis TaxID=40686 RepID=A0A9Q0ZCX7_SALVM|nr:SKP1-LIKE PROTEIN 20 [Salix viminalis]